MRPTVIPRRRFLEQTTSCAAHLAIAATLSPTVVRALWAVERAGPVVAQEPFGRLERIAEGVWALVSTPLSGDRTTLANGGIVAGRSGVLAIEGFYQSAGARWLAARARELTGRWPTHVALTHYHSDHANGIAGYRAEAAAMPAIHATERTRDEVLQRNRPADADRTAALRDALLLSPSAPEVLDLGGRTVRLVPRDGHTSSDVTVEIEDPSIVFCGDLVWNAMFPNYVDAAPTRLSAAVRALRRDRETIYVPGHGSVAGATELTRYQAMLDEIEQAAREAHAGGVSAASAGAEYALPDTLGEWTLFSRTFFERAFATWYRELDG